MLPDRATLLAKRREAKLKAKVLFRKTLGRAGALLPVPLKLRLARRSTKLGYLLLNDGDFVIDDFFDDIRLVVSAKSEVERVLLTRSYEPEVLETVRRHVQPGDWCLDIGANVGVVALCMARRVGPAGRVICFEPGPLYVKRFEENLRLNPELAPAVELRAQGLSDVPGELFWREDPAFPGNAYLLGTHGLRVPVTTLDAAFAAPPPRLDFIKIDVEGMEHEVLGGGRALIERYRPRILLETLMEFEFLRKRPVRKLAADFLESLGYTFYSPRIDGSLEPTAYPHFPANTLAIPTRRGPVAGHG